MKKCTRLNWNFKRGGEEFEKKKPPWRRYGYILELHNTELELRNILGSD